jgi:antitoxin YefM
MNAITYTTARENLAKTIEKVVSDRDPVIITKKNDMSVVMMALEEYESLQETAHLLRSPQNVLRLLESINELNEGKGTEREIIE